MQIGQLIKSFNFMQKTKLFKEFRKNVSFNNESVLNDLLLLKR